MFILCAEVYKRTDTTAGEKQSSRCGVITMIWDAFTGYWIAWIITKEDVDKIESNKPEKALDSKNHIVNNGHDGFDGLFHHIHDFFASAFESNADPEDWITITNAINRTDNLLIIFFIVESNLLDPFWLSMIGAVPIPF